MPTRPDVEEVWRAVLSGQYPVLRHGYYLLGRFPAQTRCKNCKAPFDGFGAIFMRWLGRAPNHRNPRFCNF